VLLIQVFAISGSLRGHSTNSALIQRYAQLAAGELILDVYDGLSHLPHFNPDLEPSDPFVIDLIDRIRQADAFIVSTPEYAHGIPGSLKNALDWLVSTDAFIEKPFALLQACPRSTFAPASLIEILKTMSGIHVQSADVTIDLKRSAATAEDILQTCETVELLHGSMRSLMQHCEQTYDRS
jgi:chromate reductase, NAD(P)H dehydrogenase (quinone)